MGINEGEELSDVHEVFFCDNFILVEQRLFLILKVVSKDKNKEKAIAKDAPMRE